MSKSFLNFTVIVQRTRAGPDSAGARGRKGGRPKGLAIKYQKMVPSGKNLYELDQQSTTEIMNSFQIRSRRAFYKVLRHTRVIIKPIERSAHSEDVGFVNCV